MATLSTTRFKIEIEGMDGLGSWIAADEVEYRHQVNYVFEDHSLTPVPLPGKTSAGSVVLTRVLDTDPRLFKWSREQAKDKRNGSIVYLDYQGQEQRRTNWSAGWVSKYQRGRMNATAHADGPMTETITIEVTDIFE